MKSFRKELWFEVSRRRQLINITPDVQEALIESGIREGLCLVNAMHISASVFINDDESGLHHDFEIWLENWLPKNPMTNTGTMEPRIMRTPTSNAPSWGAR
jgi:thiamine phosphate synthase YjbQ (UPF0047 family)